MRIESTHARGSDGTVRRRGRELGWLSLGLGAVQLAAPAAVRRAAGIDNSSTSRRLIPLVGLRELTQAAGLLTSGRIGPWAWSRVAGDAMDLTAAGVALARRRGQPRARLAGVTGALAGITVIDVLTAVQATQARQNGHGERARKRLDLTAAITVRKPPAEVYEFWRRLENLPTFMAHLEEVRVTDDRRSHWTATAPFGARAEWDAEIVHDSPGEQIAWRSADDTPVSNSGVVRFALAPDGRSCELHLELSYDVPSGAIGAAIARYFGEDPHQQVDDDLRRLKQVLEAGEVVRSDGAPGGKRARREFPQRPAAPLPMNEKVEEVAS
jgi:uncharacterized membrane protein